MQRRIQCLHQLSTVSFIVRRIGCLPVDVHAVVSVVIEELCYIFHESSSCSRICCHRRECLCLTWTSNGEHYFDTSRLLLSNCRGIHEIARACDASGARK